MSPRPLEHREAVREQYATACNLDARSRLHATYSTNERGWFPWVMDRVLAGSHEAILDVGGGPGGLWAEQGSRLRGDERLVLTDLSAGMVAQARARTHGHARYTVASAEVLPFAEASFDVIVANHMLYHVPDLDAALAEFVRVLTDGGRLVAATNGAGHMRQLGELAGLNPGGWLVRGFDLDDGGAKLERHFADVRLESYDDALVVPEAEPILDYIESMAAFWGDESTELLRTTIDDVITREGAFRIDKRVGLFTAVRP